MNLSWTASTDNTGGSGVAGYKIERCAGVGCTSFSQIATSTTTSFASTGLSSGTSYSYRVRAYDRAGNDGGYSNIGTATPPVDTIAPSAPSSLTASVASSSQVNLFWTASIDTGSSGLAGYMIEKCAGKGCTSFAQTGVTTSGGGTSFSVTGLTKGKSYSFRVRAYDGANNYSGYSNIVTAEPK